MTEKDLMTTLTLEKYVSEIMKIPLVSEQQANRYNHSGEGNRNPKAAAYTRSFSQYRSVRARERKTQLRLLELTAELLKAERNDEQNSQISRLKRELTEQTVKFERLRERRREIEKLRDEIDNEFAREVVTHRYFEDLDRRTPTWLQTCTELGIALNGKELRQYICSVLCV